MRRTIRIGHMSLDWIIKRGQTEENGTEKSAANRNEPVRPNVRLKETGDPIKRGDRVIVYEPFQHGREANRPPYRPGIVASVYHMGMLVTYGRAGMRPGDAPIGDVRHATQEDVGKYAKEFAAIEARIRSRQRSVNWER